MTRRLCFLIVLGFAAAMVSGCSAPESVAPEHAASVEIAAEPAVDSLDYPRWETHEPGDHAVYNRRVNMLQRGREVYTKYCAGCHGLTGAGDGPAAARLITQPRDLTSGIYKFRSTDSGSLPMEADLYRTITRGLTGVSMPGFPLMPHRDKVAVIEYIKRMYPDWENEAGRRRLVPVPRAPVDLETPRRVERGRIVYISMQCSQCHGTDGRGTGATQTEYTDAWGNPQKPFDFTSGLLKGGGSPESIYRTFHTGLRSIMPSYGTDTLKTVAQQGFPPQAGLLEAGELERLGPALADFPQTTSSIYEMTGDEQRRLGVRNGWDLVAYIHSLIQSTSTADAVLGRPAEGAIE